MTDKVSKFELVKIDDFLIFKWFAMDHNDYDNWDRFTSKKSALKWIKKNQRQQVKDMALKEYSERYIILENGSVTQVTFTSKSIVG